MRKMANRQKVSSELRAALKRSGMSAYRISKESGVTISTVTRFLAEERDLSLTSVDKLCRLLGLRLCDANKLR